MCVGVREVGEYFLFKKRKVGKTVLKQKFQSDFHILASKNDVSKNDVNMADKAPNYFTDLAN